MELVNFKNFEEFRMYIKQHVRQMPYWTREQHQEFEQKIRNLYENCPEFQEKYDSWIKKMEMKQKKAILIGGTKEETEKSRLRLQALIKLKKIKSAQQENNRQKTKKSHVIEMTRRKKQYTI